MSFLGADLTYLNFVVGVLCMFAYQPVQDWLYRRGTYTPTHCLTARRCCQARRKNSSGSAFPHISRHRVALPDLAFLVRVHVRRKRVLGLPTHRGWCSRILRPYSVACHVELYHRFVSERCGECDRCFLTAKFHDCGGPCACWHCHV
jgi:hypothetical protein